MVTRDEALHQTLGRTLAGEAMITRDEALRRIRAQVEARYRLKSPPWQWAPQDEEKAAKHLDALEALGLIELAPAPIAAQVQLRADVLNCLSRLLAAVGPGTRSKPGAEPLSARTTYSACGPRSGPSPPFVLGAGQTTARPPKPRACRVARHAHSGKVPALAVAAVSLRCVHSQCVIPIPLPRAALRFSARP